MRFCDYYYDYSQFIGFILPLLSDRSLSRCSASIHTQFFHALRYMAMVWGKLRNSHTYSIIFVSIFNPLETGGYYIYHQV